MSFSLKRSINTTLRGLGVKTFDASAKNILAEFLESEGGEEPLKDFVRVWKSGPSWEQGGITLISATPIHEQVHATTSNHQCIAFTTLGDHSE